MKHSAMKMIAGMMAIAILISVKSGSVLPVIIVAAAGYTTWCIAKGFDGGTEKTEEERNRLVVA